MLLVQNKHCWRAANLPYSFFFGTAPPVAFFAVATFVSPELQLASILDNDATSDRPWASVTAVSVMTPTNRMKSLSVGTTHAVSAQYNCRARDHASLHG